MIDKTTVLVYNIYVLISEDAGTYMQTYRSGHNGADSKSVCGQPHVSSNLTVCANKRLYKKDIARENPDFIGVFTVLYGKISATVFVDVNRSFSLYIRF